MPENTTIGAAEYAEKLTRWGGCANILGGVCVASAYLLHPPTAPVDVVGSGYWVFVHTVFLVSLLAGVFGLFALMSACVARGGRGGAVLGTALAVTSLVLIAGLDYAEVFIFPTLAHEFPAVVEKYGAGDTMPSIAFAFPASGALFVVGYLLLAQALRKNATVTNSSAVVTMFGVAVFTVGLSGFVPMVVTQAGATLFGLGLILMGLDLWRYGIRGTRA